MTREAKKGKNSGNTANTFFFSRSLADLSPLLDRVFRTETALDIPEDRFFIKIYVPPENTTGNFSIPFAAKP